MPSPLAIAQFARIVGRDDLLTQLGLPSGAALPDALTDAQRGRARLLAAERTDQIAGALLEEAMALDDIQDTAGAVAYLDERLAFFSTLLTDDARAAIRDRFIAVAGQWERR